MYTINKMVYNGYSGLLFLFIILLLAVIGSLVSTEGFENNKFLQSASVCNSHPTTDKKQGRLLDSYPATDNRNVSDYQYDDIWWYLPVFQVGSYAQITNNLKHYKNPDIGRCINADFCGTLYKDAMVQSNISKPLPPVEKGHGARVNYYNTPYELMT